MELKLEKSIPFTREKKIKTPPVFVIRSLLRAVSVLVLYTSCMGESDSVHTSPPIIACKLNKLNTILWQ